MVSINYSIEPICLRLIIQVSHLNSVHKSVVDILGLHSLADQVGNTTKNSVHCGDLAIPGEKRRDSSSVTTGRFGATVDVFYELAKMQWLGSIEECSLCIFLAIAILRHQAIPTALLNKTVGKTL